MSALLQAEGLRVGYGAIEVLKGVSLSVEAGATLAIVGPNGAGKTTLFKALTGEIMCHAGRISFLGKDVTTARAHERTVLGMGRTFQTSRIFPEFTVTENVVAAIEARERSAGTAQGPWWRWRVDSAASLTTSSLCSTWRMSSQRRARRTFALMVVLSHSRKDKLAGGGTARSRKSCR